MGGVGKQSAVKKASPQDVPASELAAAFEHAPVGMAITDQGAVLLHANRALADMLGFEPNELVGKSVVALTHPVDLAESQASNASLRRGDATHFALKKRYLHKSGRVVWARVYVSLLTDGPRRHHLLHVVDITREKESLDELRRAEQRFREMADSIEQDFWVLHLEPRELLYVTPAAARIWGFDTMVNRERPGKIASLVHPADRAMFNELFAPPLGDTREGEYRIIRADGAERWLRTHVFPIRDANGHVDRLTGVTEDITARKEAELKLARHSAFERLVLELSTAFVNLPLERIREGFETALRELGTLIGAEAGAIFLMDDAGERIGMRYWWSTDEAARTTPVLFAEYAFGPDHPLRIALTRDGLLCIDDVAALPDSAAEIRERISSNGIRSFIDVPLLRRGKLIGLYGFGTTTRPMQWSGEVAERLRIAAELFCNALDRASAEAEIRTHRDALAHALRVGTMGQLASGIAHELNQPLAAILNYASGWERRLAAGDLSDDDSREAVQRIAEQAIRAADVMKTLRALVRKSEGDRTWQDPNVLVRNALTFVAAEATSAGVELTTDLAAPLPSIQVDAIQIEQVVLNLLRNALDAVGTAKELDGARRPEIRIATGTDLQGNVEIVVSDNGPGIEIGREARVFEEFHTTKPGGLGLGLSISRSIVEAHGGRLELVATPSRGAVLRVVLSAATKPSGS